MPMYDYRCPDGHEFENFVHLISRVEEHVALCPVCGKPSSRLLSLGTKYRFAPGSFFEPYVDMDITGDPIRIDSQDQFFRECEKHGKGYRKVPDRLR